MIRSIIVLSLCSIPALAQTTTNTHANCTIVGNTVDCTGTSYTYRPVPSASPDVYTQQQSQNYETGRVIGAALGNGIAAIVRSHRIKKFCQQHPGYGFQYVTNQGAVTASGTCAR